MLTFKRSLATCLFIGLFACGDSESDNTPELASRRWTSLSDAEYREACELIAKEGPPDTIFTCDQEDSPAFEADQTIVSASTCVTDERLPETCPLTVQEVLDCYVAVQIDACKALEEGGECDWFSGPNEAACL